MPCHTIGICGPTGSGKTTLAERITQLVTANGISCVVVHCDGFYNDYSHLSLEERKKMNWDDPKHINFKALGETLKALRSGESSYSPGYDFKTSKSIPNQIVIPAASVVIVEGLYVCLHEELRSLFDMKIFVDSNIEACFVRRYLRDVTIKPIAANMLAEKKEAIRAATSQFVLPQKQYCEIVLSERETLALKLLLIHSEENKYPVQSLLDTVHSEREIAFVSPLLDAISFWIKNWEKSAAIAMYEANTRLKAAIKLTETNYSLFSLLHPHSTAIIESGEGLQPEEKRPPSMRQRSHTI